MHESDLQAMFNITKKKGGGRGRGSSKFRPQKSLIN